jgi:hypothetical protein
MKNMRTLVAMNHFKRQFETQEKLLKRLGNIGPAFSSTSRRGVNKSRGGDRNRKAEFSAGKRTSSGIPRVMKFLIILLVLRLAVSAEAGKLPPIQTVFIILMENADWSTVENSPSAPYLNSMLASASYCENYHNPIDLHPSEPNYIWLEAGTNFGIVADNYPSVDHVNSTQHLTALLNNANISWKTYQEDIDGNSVPLTPVNGYVPRHNPFVYFDDITGTNDPDYAYGIAHIRPYSEFAGDLAANNVARYNFITPDLCDDMHDSCPPLTNQILQGDAWLSTEIARITNSQAWQNNGAIFITWDESQSASDPIGMVVISRLARGNGYHNNIFYTHSSTLLTVQEIFGVRPLLGDAANATDLSELFPQFEISGVTVSADGIQFTVNDVIPGTTNLVEMSTNLTDWICVGTNVATTNSFVFAHSAAGNAEFYRAVQFP